MHKTIDPKGYGISKAKLSFIKEYESLFTPLVGQAISLLELGAFKGASLRFWRDYFENATIIGLDCNPAVKIDDPNGKIHIYKGYQQDIQLLDRIVEEQAPEGFDVIIDDCSHIGRFARMSFWHLFQNHLKPGGLYAIEDWGAGYVRYWPYGSHYRLKSRLRYPRHKQVLDLLSESSGYILSRAFPKFPKLAAIPRLFGGMFIGSAVPSHKSGMAGFAKELLDGCYLGYRAIPRSGKGRYFDYGISQIHINWGLIIVSKSMEKDAFRIDSYLTKDGRFTPLALGIMSEED